MKNKFLTGLAIALMISGTSYGQASISTGTPYTGNIYHTGGNVGIGTSTPGHKLDVLGNDNNNVIGNSTNAALRIINTNPGSGWNNIAELQFGSDALATQVGLMSAITCKLTSVNGTTLHTGGDLIFSTKNATTETAISERMRINGIGYVGIGTTTPAEKLDVNGAIKIGSTTGTAAGTIEYEGNWFYLRTANGYIQFGPANSSWAHIYTDRAKFLFDKPIYVATGNIHSYDNANLTLNTNATARMTILNTNGNVGIGVTNPAEKLEVVGNARFSGFVDAGYTSGNRTSIGYDGIHCMIDGYNSNSAERILLINYNSGGDVFIGKQDHTYGPSNLHITGQTFSRGSVSIGNGGVTPTSRLYVKGTGADNSTSSLNITNSNDASMLFVRDDGHVGIGTTTPTAELAVTSANNPSISLVTSSTTNQGDILFYQTNENTSNLKGLLRFNVDNNGGTFEFQNRVGTPQINLKIAGNGNVLIGKTTQANTIYKLDVAGSVRADEVVVNTTGADFVFENGYKLKSLNEVENYINENKHLPDVPSASEMQENGMSIGETNTVLLQKIEELTLYVIEQQKQIDELKKAQLIK